MARNTTVSDLCVPANTNHYTSVCKVADAQKCLVRPNYELSEVEFLRLRQRVDTLQRLVETLADRLDGIQGVHASSTCTARHEVDPEWAAAFGPLPYCGCRSGGV